MRSLTTPKKGMASAMNHTNRAAGWGVGGHHRMHDSGSSSNSSGAAQHASNGVPWYQHTSAVMKLAAHQCQVGFKLLTAPGQSEIAGHHLLSCMLSTVGKRHPYARCSTVLTFITVCYCNKLSQTAFGSSGTTMAGLGWVAQVVQQATGTGCTT
jgi:hypothetical protein